MKIHHLRNATFIIEKGDHFILIDPMLGAKGSIPPFVFFRQKPRRNPMADLPSGTETLLSKVTHAVITHLHPDHLDEAGFRFLVERQIPVSASRLDSPKLKKKGVKVVQSLDYWRADEFLGGSITGIPAIHGYGFIARLMGNVMGFVIEFIDHERLYISSDTIYTSDVDRVLRKMKPDLSVLAAGSAQFDLWGKLLMNQQDILTFVKNAPGKVYANHMDVINHCPITRDNLKALLKQEKLESKVVIPDDGATLDIQN